MIVPASTYIYIYLGLYLLVVIAILDIARRITNMRHLIKQKTVVLELTPPVMAQKAPTATEQFFNVVHTVASQRSLLQRLLGRRDALSLEIVSSRKQGIRYLIRLAESEAAIFERQLTSYLPEVRFKEVEDYLFVTPANKKNHKVIEFKQARHFAYPLAIHDSLSHHDPVAYITGSMTKLAPDELIAFQIVLSPVDSAEANRIRNTLIQGKDPQLNRVIWLLPFRIVGFVLRMISNVLFSVLYIIGGITASNHGTSRNYPSRYAAPAEEPKITTAAQAVIDSLNAKLSQPLFQTSVRTLVVTTNLAQTRQSLKSMCAAVGALSVPGYQALIVCKRFPALITTRYRWFMFRRRLPPFFATNATTLAVSEVASLYHFPYAGTNKTENIVKSLSRTLPAPLSLKNSSVLDVLIGKNEYHGVTTAIGLTEKERERHMYVVGGTGNGKTTMLQYMIVQDIQNGKGVAVIDPHGDMAQEIISRIPEERIKDVIYFNPDDLSYPIGMNLLELDDTLEGDDLLREKDLITESVVSIFRKIFSDDDSGGHRIEYILRNATQTALTVKDSTLFTIYDLLNDARYRRKVITTLEDENLQKFWRNEFGRAGSYQQVKMAAGITAKVGRFLFSASAKRILEQPTSTINFDSIMDESKILICNFSKGLIGEDTSELLGIAVLAKLQLASLRRARMSQTERKPFYLYVDEFQNFATVSFVQMLSESRKYKLFLTMAEQSTSQQTDKDMVNIILANVGTVVTFRTGNPADEKILLPLFNPYLDEGEIMNLASFHFYVRLAAIHSQEPLSGLTVLLENEGSMEIAEQVQMFSRKSYGRFHESSRAHTASQVTPNTELPRRKKQSAKPYKATPITAKYRT
jgi:hypothetical protein